MMLRTRNLWIAAVVAAIVVVAAAINFAGSLDPTGPPAPTMVTLSQLSTQVSQSASDLTEQIHQSTQVGNFCVLTSTNAYAFNSSTGNWVALSSMTGTGLNVVGSNGTCCVLTASTAYAYSNGAWSTGQTLNPSGSSATLIAANGNCSVMTSSYAYAFSGGIWHTQQQLQGTTVKITGS